MCGYRFLWEMEIKMTDKAGLIERLRDMATAHLPITRALLDEAADALASREACIEKLKETLQWIVNASCQYHNTDSGFIISGIEQHARNVLKELESK